MGAVDIITILIPIYYLVMAVFIILGIVLLIKVIRRYLKNSELLEQKFKRENEDIKEIKDRLNRIEEKLKDVD